MDNDRIEKNDPSSKRRWTEEETAFLRKHYIKKGRKFVAEALSRTTTCVAGKARTLGLRREPHKPWTTFEDNYIRRNFESKPARSIARTLARTIHAVHARASTLGLTGEKIPPYTNEERTLIKELYESGVSATRIAVQLGRPESSIRTRINRWGFKSSRPWSAKEERFLKKNFGTMKIAKIAESLGRTVSAVNHYASRHGLGSPRNAESAEQAPDTLQNVNDSKE